MEYFLAVAQTGSITAAAAQLHMTQPPLSQAIAALERDIGVCLLRRQSRGVQLTAAGEVLAQDGLALLEWETEMVKNVQDVADGLTGSMTLAVTPAAWWFELPALIRHCHERLPGVDFTFRDMPPTDTLEQVRDRRADIGFVMTAEPDTVAQSYPDLEVRSISESPLLMTVPDTMPVMEPASVHDFTEVPWIIPARVAGFPGPLEIFEKLWHPPTDVIPTVWQVSTIQSAIPLIADGAGVTLMPATFQQHLSTRARTVELKEQLPSLYTAVIWHHTRQLEGAFGAFMDLLDLGQVGEIDGTKK